MPNHVTTKLLFPAARLTEVRDACFRKDVLDFATLIPPPPHMHDGGLSLDDEKDFPCNWMTWCTANWGTKWNAYACSTGTEGERAFIKLDTAWSVPRPVIYALGKRFGLEMEVRYFDEGHNFWGVEFYGFGNAVDESAYQRKSRDSRKSAANEERPLCIELKGYDPEERE